MKMDGYDDCFIGKIIRFGQEPILCYSYEKVVKSNMKAGMTREEAEEFFEYNQIGSWVGEGTPCFLVKATMKEVDEEAEE